MNYFLPSVIVLIASVLILFITKKPFNELGLNISKVVLKYSLIGFTISLFVVTLIFLSEYYFQLTSSKLRILSLPEMVTFTFFMVFIFLNSAFIEEMIFRGVVFQELILSSNKTIATIIFSFLFSIGHIFNPSISILAFVNIFLAGIWLSIAKIMSQTLWLPIMLHFGWNFSLSYIFSYEVSGNTFTEFQFGELIVTGPRWLTGGHFGPEGGIVGTIGVLFATAATIFICKKIDKQT
ncbi:MAG: CPBP family intramembrane metalloprotease [Ignavibacteria bacterium]|nr:CPBP family intramembrane metalloprotease [Bacteroidota bacterium]MSQ46114.1 CPBP family intramembrane metalloprotease [Ignavibacteria bacterium]